MSKPKNPDKAAVITFRTSEEVKKRLQREAKRRKQKPAEAAEAIFVPALDQALAAAG